MKRPVPTSRNKLYATPEEAEGAFYDAFERADLAAMMAVWAERDDIVCVHPDGPRLLGFEAVRESWVQIFAGGAQLRVRVVDAQSFDGPDIAVRSVIEMLAPPGRPEPMQAVCATNVFELTENGWRMVVHHATPAPEAVPSTAEDDDDSPSHTLH
jgi:uncharacterized protein (TIGR02246 family)